MKAAGNLFLLFLACSLFLGGCNRENTVFLTYQHIPEQSWDDNFALSFSPEINNVAIPYNLWIELRHDNDYPYRNIWFFVSISQNDSVLQKDTLQYILADDFGKWQGRGCNAFYQQTLIYKHSYQFPDTGKYDIRVQHAMRDRELKGVEDVGLRIEYAR